MTEEATPAYRAGRWTRQHPVKTVVLLLLTAVVLVNVFRLLQPPTVHVHYPRTASAREACEQKWERLALANQTYDTHSAFVNACVVSAGG